MRINCEPARSRVVSNQASVSSLCRWDVTVSLSPKGMNHRVHRASFTDHCRLAVLLVSFFHVHGNAFTEEAGLQPEKIVVPHGDVLAASQAGHSKFRAASKVRLRRERVPELTCRDVSGDSRRRQTWTVPKSVDDRGCPQTLLRPTYRQLLPQIEQFPACLWVWRMLVTMARRIRTGIC